MPENWVFDKPHSVRCQAERIEPLDKFLPELVKSFGLKSALDVGCGTGRYSGYLADLGLEAVGIDAKPENISEAKRRHPDITFKVYNAEDPSIQKLGLFDLVFCFGLLYHLENIFIAIRNFQVLASKFLFIESMYLPDLKPTLYLHDEAEGQDQSLRMVAFYPSESCIVKMCYRAGFPFVYRFIIDSASCEDFRANLFRKKMRTLLIASKVYIDSPSLAIISEPQGISDPWETFFAKVFSLIPRLKKFLRKPWSQKIWTASFKIAKLWYRLFPWTFIPIRLSFGAWWLAWNDAVSQAIFSRDFEKFEHKFVECFLKPGMVMVDAGAHHGFYTLLAAKKVGPQGKVIAFEPSPRELRRLRWCLVLNRCRNVQIEPVALGSSEGVADLFVCLGKETGCNSLRPPAVSEALSKVSVAVTTLDCFLQRSGIQKVDLIKIDVEGAELEVLRGAGELLQRRPRPIICCEVQDLRTKPWGYRAKEIIKLLSSYGYYWFEPLREGKLKMISIDKEDFENNFIAVPAERLEQIAKFLQNTD